ncbi:MAG: AEC family transporter [bacterium]|nr:AEC family transporter [bacterium]
MDIGVILGQMLVLFAMMLTGTIVYKKKWLTEEGANCVSKLVVNVFNPLLVVSGVLGDTDAISADKIVGNVKLVFLYYAIAIVVGIVLARVLHPPKHLKSIYTLMATFSNLGFMGIPVAKSLYGDEGVVYVSFYVLIYNILVYTYGMSLARRAAREKNGISTNEKVPLSTSLMRIMNPGVVAAVLALVIFAVKINVAAPVISLCDYMGNATIPLSMIMIGVSIAKADLKTYVKDLRMYAFILLRMLALPIGLAIGMRGLGFDRVVFGVFIIEMAMPIGSVIGLFAKECGADDDYCMKGTVFSALASIVTIPIVGMFL